MSEREEVASVAMAALTCISKENHTAAVAGGGGGAAGQLWYSQVRNFRPGHPPGEPVAGLQPT